MNAVRQKAVVRNGRLEIAVPELAEGTQAEVLVLTEDIEELEDARDVRDYLEAKTANETPIPFDEAIAQIEATHA